MPRSGLPNLPGAAIGRATGLATHEACFKATAATAYVRVARSRQFPRFGAVAPWRTGKDFSAHFVRDERSGSTEQVIERDLGLDIVPVGVVLQPECRDHCQVDGLSTAEMTAE